ncbi:MAG: HD domain-containing protein [Planctomycetota bacterium]|jgi:HD-GYP domain-containing protein (c-di-GMP phosphodiesterase class II)|nr:MAG: HD domain-containing protein [Planctomycetota bacterium]
MMHRKTRFLLMLLIAQASCLAAGLVVHTRQQIILAQTSAGNHSVRDSILIGANIFVWTFGLQATVAWILITRLYGKHEEQEGQSRDEVYLRTQQLIRTRDAVIFGLAKLAESRDPDTGHHLERIAAYSTRLATAIRRHPKYREQISAGYVSSIGINSALHDIGKVGIPDNVLLKPGRLTEDEIAIMRLHPRIGADCIEQIQRRLGESIFLQQAREIALYHHERWDGTGYPFGLHSEEIPLSARIVTIADVYDALTSRRVYKEPYSHKISVEKIKQGAGRHFDPHLVDIFLSIESQFEEIAISLRAPDESSPSRNNQGEDRVEDLMTEEAGDLIEAVTSVIAGSPGYHVLP